MFHVHSASQTERLLTRLAQVIRQGGKSDPFAPEYFLLQSRGMEQLVAQCLAREFGSFCNFSFLLPLDCLGMIAGRLGVNAAVEGYDRSILTWRLDSLLRDPDLLGLAPLAGYLTGSNTERKRYQLAARLASCFDRYQQLRPSLIEAWDKGELLGLGGGESWQQVLWHRLTAGAGIHRTRLFRQLIERLQGGGVADLLPERLSVVGIHLLPPLYLDFLVALGEHCDVHLYLLSPCRHYWGDMAPSRKSELRHQNQVEDDLFWQSFDRDHPLLVSLGKQGRDFQRLLYDRLDTYEDDQLFLSHAESTEKSLLERLQNDLLEGRLPQENSGTCPGGDGSIRIVSCHTRMRELMVLKDHLLALLDAHPTLELRDVVVMAPDIEVYSPLIPVVFHDLPHAVADRSLRVDNQLLTAFTAFLALFPGRFGWAEVLDVLNYPNVFPQFDLERGDLSLLEHWVREAGVRWGISRGQRYQDEQGDFAESSWRAGLDRLLMGCAIDCDLEVAGILPFTEIEGRQSLALGGLCSFVDFLDEMRQLFAHRRPLSAWYRVLMDCLEKLFGESNPEMVEAEQLLSQLQDAANHGHQEDVGFAVISEWFTASCQQCRGSSGFLRGQLTFCSMLPMRSIPFAVISLLGLNDTDFPRDDGHGSFDLTQSRSELGDRSARSDDRYLFLEAILSARKVLYLSYQGQSSRNNEKVPPSVLVAELLDVLAEHYGVRDVVIEHGLHPFSARYFDGRHPSVYFSYDTASCELAQKMRGLPEQRAGWWTGELSSRVTQITFSQLLRFFKNPPNFFVREVLGVVAEDGGQVLPEEEAFAVDGLQAFLVREELLRNFLAGGQGQILPRLQAEGRWPLGATGKLAFYREHEQVAEFASRLQAISLGPQRSAEPFSLTINGLLVNGELSHVHEEGLLLARTTKLTGKDILGGWLHHLLYGRTGGRGPTWVAGSDKSICFQGYQGDNLEDLLDLFVQGNRQPLPLFPAMAWDYITELHQGRKDVGEILTGQRKAIARQMEEGWEPEWLRLFPELLQQDADLGPFASVATRVMESIWENVNGR